MRFCPRPLAVGAATAALGILGGCGPSPEVSPLRYEAPISKARPVLFAIHPLHSPRMLLDAYTPLANYLEARGVGDAIRVEASRDYAAFEDKIRRREPDLLLPNPWQTLLALHHGYKVVAMAGDQDDFRGLFLARRDSKVNAPADLRGQEVAYPARTAVAAALLPQQFLHDHGLAVDKDVRSLYVGSQESAILHVWSGKVGVAATWPPPWRAFQAANPQQAAELQVLWQTPALPNNAVMARDDLPAQQLEQLRAVLLDMHRHVDGRKVLEVSQTSRFWPADDATYAPVRDFVQRFEREVRVINVPPAAAAVRP